MSEDGNRKEKPKIGRSLFSPRRYLIFFLLIAFVVTTCFLLFLHFLEIRAEDVHKAALLTFGNVLLLSFLGATFDGIRQKYTRGDFSARIEQRQDPLRHNEFDVIIADFNKMAEELSGIETLRTDFIASVSHELKTPLAVMQNYATLLQAPDLPEEKRIEYGRAIAEASRRLSELITNILRLNKLENQTIFPDSIRFNLGEQLRECVLSLEDVWEQKELELDIDIDDVMLNGDPELLTLVWNNLLSNAMKFTGPGGFIGVTVKEEEQWAVVSVRDTGCGMTAETGRHIFEKFYQGDSSHSSQGNGLGLALVKRVIDIMNGEISVESAPGVGSVFTVRLPK